MSHCLHYLILCIACITFRPASSIYSQPEVISSHEWKELKPESRGGFSNWIKRAVGKSDMQDGFYQKLHFILSTSPMWDRYILRSFCIIFFYFFKRKKSFSDTFFHGSLYSSR